MNKTETKRLIDTAFHAIGRAAQSDSEASRLLDRALAAAVEGEKGHRRMGRGLGGYRMSVETAARYFVVKWFAEPAKVQGARAACSLRLDCLCASALRELFETEGLPIPDLCGAPGIDYVTDIVG